jgi:hypothetical protein
VSKKFKDFVTEAEGIVWAVTNIGLIVVPIVHTGLPPGLDIKLGAAFNAITMAAITTQKVIEGLTGAGDLTHGPVVVNTTTNTPDPAATDHATAVAAANAGATNAPSHVGTAIGGDPNQVPDQGIPAQGMQQATAPTP